MILARNGSGPIEVNDMHVIDQRCRPAVRGAMYHMPPEGEQSKIDVAFNLDLDNPVARTFSLQSMELGAPYFQGSSFRIKKDDPTEATNLAAKNPEKVKELTELLGEIQKNPVSRKE